MSDSSGAVMSVLSPPVVQEILANQERPIPTLFSKAQEEVSKALKKELPE
jgi:hypothetical protein